MADTYSELSHYNEAELEAYNRRLYEGALHKLILVEPSRFKSQGFWYSEPRSLEADPGSELRDLILTTCTDPESYKKISGGSRMFRASEMHTLPWKGGRPVRTRVAKLVSDIKTRLVFDLLEAEGVAAGLCEHLGYEVRDDYKRMLEERWENAAQLIIRGSEAQIPHVDDVNGVGSLLVIVYLTPECPTTELHASVPEPEEGRDFCVTILPDGHLVGQLHELTGRTWHRALQDSNMVSGPRLARSSHDHGAHGHAPRTWCGRKLNGALPAALQPCRAQEGRHKAEVGAGRSLL